MRRGFNLLEMIVATAVAALVLICLSPIWPATSRAIGVSRNRLAGLQVASQQLEESLGQGYAAMTDRTGSVTLTSTIRGVPRTIRYDYGVVVTPVPPDLRSVLVRVRWTEGERQLEESLEALVVDPN
ncbi:MAG: prepilin-type N-terminal cleavage/methylation domain-containing protein [Candidatus Eremiobacterota bacterium]